jgi:hypothetical protein
MMSGKIHTARCDKTLCARTGKAFPVRPVFLAAEDELPFIPIPPAGLTLAASREVLPATSPPCTDTWLDLLRCDRGGAESGTSGGGSDALALCWRHAFGRR